VNSKVVLTASSSGFGALSKQPIWLRNIFAGAATVVLAEVSLNGNLFHGAVSQISLRRHGETGSVPMRAVDLFDAAEKGCAECCTKYIDQAG